MRSILIAFVVVIAACSSRSAVLYSAVPTLRAAYPFVYTTQGNSLITPTQQQYQSQDQLGQYAYGYSEPLSSKQEVRSLDGITRGSYSYRDATGKLQTVDYTADAEGFHVAATNLPQAVKSLSDGSSGRAAVGNFRTPEASIATIAYAAAPIAAVSDTGAVAAARKAHLAAHEEAKLRLAQGSAVNTESAAAGSDVRILELPAPVADTADVAAAKSIHLKRVEAEKLRNDALGAHEAASVGRAAVVPSVVAVPSVYNYGYGPQYFSSGFYY